MKMNRYYLILVTVCVTSSMFVLDANFRGASAQGHPSFGSSAAMDQAVRTFKQRREYENEVSTIENNQSERENEARDLERQLQEKANEYQSLPEDPGFEAAASAALTELGLNQPLTPERDSQGNQYLFGATSALTSSFRAAIEGLIEGSNYPERIRIAKEYRELLNEQKRIRESAESEQARIAELQTEIDNINENFQLGPYPETFEYSSAYAKALGEFSDDATPPFGAADGSSGSSGTH